MAGVIFFFFFSLPFFFFGCPLRKVFIGVVRKEGRWRIVSAFPFTVFGNMMARLEGYFEVSLFRDAVHPQTRSALGSRSRGGSTGVCRRLRVAFLRILYVFSLFSSFLLLLGAVWCRSYCSGNIDCLVKNLIDETCNGHVCKNDKSVCEGNSLINA